MSGEGFLSRWSRRKRGVEPEAPEPEAPAAETPASKTLAAPQGSALARPGAAAPAEPEFDLASLPSLESLTAESDFTAFLRPQVPWALRQAALRRMWSLDVGIRDFVGPADYAWDFNAPDGVPGFALELGGDVKRLLAQAIGTPEPEEEKPAPEQAVVEAPPGETVPGGTVPAGTVSGAAAPEETADGESSPGEAAEPATALAAAAGTPMAPAAEPPMTPAAEPPSPLRLSGTALPLPIPAERPAAVSEPSPTEALPRRRHGGALPS